MGTHDLNYLKEEILKSGGYCPACSVCSDVRHGYDGRVRSAATMTIKMVKGKYLLFGLTAASRDTCEGDWRAMDPTDKPVMSFSTVTVAQINPAALSRRSECCYVPTRNL